jgi:hypothetical protein
VAVTELAKQGRVRLDSEGLLIGSADLTIQPDRPSMDG